MTAKAPEVIAKEYEDSLSQAIAALKIIQEDCSRPADPIRQKMAGRTAELALQRIKTINPKFLE